MVTIRMIFRTYFNGIWNVLCDDNVLDVSARNYVIVSGCRAGFPTNHNMLIVHLRGFVMKTIPEDVTHISYAFWLLTLSIFLSCM